VIFLTRSRTLGPKKLGAFIHRSCLCARLPGCQRIHGASIRLGGAGGGGRSPAKAGRANTGPSGRASSPSETRAPPGGSAGRSTADPPHEDPRAAPKAMARPPHRQRRAHRPHLCLKRVRSHNRDIGPGPEFQTSVPRRRSSPRAPCRRSSRSSTSSSWLVINRIRGLMECGATAGGRSGGSTLSMGHCDCPRCPEMGREEPVGARRLECNDASADRH
jgi:hypothetical protein